MTKLAADISKCYDLADRLRELGVGEIAILDTNVIIQGAFPRYRPHKPYQQPLNSNWQAEVKDPRAIVNWLKNWHTMQVPVAPVITNVVTGEVYGVHQGIWHKTGPVSNLLSNLEESSSAFYVSLYSRNIALNKKILDDFVKYSNEEADSNDARILASAYMLCKRTGLNVTIVSANKRDFSPELQEALIARKRKDGRYIRFEAPADFRQRLGLPDAKKVNGK